MTPNDPSRSESKRDLQKAGWTAVLIALALQGLSLRWMTKEYQNEELLVMGRMIVITQLASIPILGEGLATLAEAKGHRRWHGFWSILSLLGLLIVLRLPNRCRPQSDPV